MSRAIITGATGYIGSRLANYLLNLGWEIHIITKQNFDSSNIENIKEKLHIFQYNNDINNLVNYFTLIKADVVFHLAAAVITNYTVNDIPTLIQSNIQFGTDILEAMKISHTPLLINTGSYWQNYNSNNYNPVDLYAATKEAFEKIIVYYTELKYIRCINLRLFDIYGEDDKRPKLLNKLCEIAGSEITLDISPGEQFLDMVHVSDVCKAYLLAYNYLKTNMCITNETYGIYTGKQYQLKDIIHMLQNLLGKSINVNLGGKKYKEREIMRPNYCFKMLPGWHSEIELKEGLKLLITNKIK